MKICLSPRLRLMRKTCGGKSVTQSRTSMASGKSGLRPQTRSLLHTPTCFALHLQFLVDCSEYCFLLGVMFLFLPHCSSVPSDPPCPPGQFCNVHWFSSYHLHLAFTALFVLPLLCHFFLTPSDLHSHILPSPLRVFFVFSAYVLQSDPNKTRALSKCTSEHMKRVMGGGVCLFNVAVMPVHTLIPLFLYTVGESLCLCVNVLKVCLATVFLPPPCCTVAHLTCHKTITKFFPCKRLCRKKTAKKKSFVVLNTHVCVDWLSVFTGSSL